MRPDTLGVIGLGAIGGSVAWRAASAGVRVIGYSNVPREGVTAARLGALHDVATSVRQLVHAADLIVLAAPPGANLDLLARWGEVVVGRGALLTDVTSVKRPIIELATRHGLARCFAGSHPFAGTHVQGFAAARTDLLRGAVVYVTAVPDGEDAAREVADFWESVFEAQVVRLDAAVHDERLARTSHLPQAVASALASALARQSRRGVSFGPGARDMTRLAAGSVDMWRDLLLLNRAAVLDAIEEFECEVGALRRALEDGDPDGLASWLAVGARWRRAMD